MNWTTSTVGAAIGALCTLFVFRQTIRNNRRHPTFPLKRLLLCADSPLSAWIWCNSKFSTTMRQQHNSVNKIKIFHRNVCNQKFVLGYPRVPENQSFKTQQTASFRWFWWTKVHRSSNLEESLEQFFKLYFWFRTLNDCFQQVILTQSGSIINPWNCKENYCACNLFWSIQWCQIAFARLTKE